MIVGMDVHRNRTQVGRVVVAVAAATPARASPCRHITLRAHV
jgi:hypothetical protein